MYAGQYAGGDFSVASAQLPAADSAAGCVQAAGGVPAVRRPPRPSAAAISFAEGSNWASRTCGAAPARTRSTAPAWSCGLPGRRDQHRAHLAGAVGQRDRVPASQVQPGDLVFFAGADGTVTDPGHVGMVIGGGKMIEAYATGFPIRVSSYANRGAVGFTEPWAGAKGTAPASTAPPGSTASPGAPGSTGAPGPGCPGPARRAASPSPAAPSPPRPLLARIPPLIVVDPGSAVERVHDRPPKQPPSPNQPGKPGAQIRRE